MLTAERGFSLIETMLVVAIAMVIVGTAIPAITGALESSQLNNGVQTVATVVRNARYQAVTRNVRLRVRFNCPAAGQLRIVEVTGNAAIDDAVNRCDPAVYPYPVADADPATLPNSDGPVVMLPAQMTFGAVQDLEVSPIGRITPLTACPACVAAAPPATIGVGDAHNEKRLTIAGSGQVAVSEAVHARY
jgi:type II secretory pathway pseudopilin PulG